MALRDSDSDPYDTQPSPPYHTQANEAEYQPTVLLRPTQDMIIPFPRSFEKKRIEGVDYFFFWFTDNATGETREIRVRPNRLTKAILCYQPQAGEKWSNEGSQSHPMSNTFFHVFSYYETDERGRIRAEYQFTIAVTDLRRIIQDCMSVDGLRGVAQFKMLVEHELEGLRNASPKDEEAMRRIAYLKIWLKYTEGKVLFT